MTRAAASLLVCCWFLAFIPAEAKIMVIKGKSAAEIRESHRVNLGSCDRNLLHLDYSGKYRLPLQALSSEEPKVVKILAVKVNFRREEPDDPLTTGNGNLDLRTKEEFKAQEGHPIDPAPHNNAYFLKHLEALAAYYRTVSNGRLELEYEIFPQQSDAAYQLDSGMAYYGLQLPQYGLGEFVYDAVQRADDDPALRFYDEATGKERYDAYVVFHAGSDQQNNLVGFGVYTPGDLYTGFIKLGLPFPVDGGRVVVRDAVIMPETVCQDGMVTALNAVFAHEFGHQLGMVDLYDTHGTTAVGDFSLMDNNGFQSNVDLGETVPVFVQGVMPVFPDAWTRAYLGFVDVVKVTSRKNIKVWAAELATDSAQILLVPINQDEYFLVENRRTDIDGDEAGLKADSVTDVILGPASPTTGALNREYDYLIPGSGMLIWHVDELAARLDYDGDGINNFDDNQLQWFNFPWDTPTWDNHHQFLTLEEADGIVNFGREYLAGYGSQADVFDINNNSRFAPFTNPSSASNIGAYTGITIGDISAALLIMTCDVQVEGKAAGWPNYTGVSSLPLVASDLDGDGNDEIITAVDSYILAYRFDGTALLTPPPGKEVVVTRQTLYGEGRVSDTLAVYAHIADGQYFTHPLAAADLDGSGRVAVVGVTSENTLVCFLPPTIDLYEAVKAFEEPIAAPAATAPLILDYDQNVADLEVLVYNSLGEKLVFDKMGNRLLEETRAVPFRVMSDSLHRFELISLAPPEDASQPSAMIRGAAAADFDRDGDNETAEVYLDGTLKINYAQRPVVVDVGAPVFSEIALGDIDDNGYVEILFCGDNLIYAYNHNGTLVSNFPIVVNPAAPAGPVVSSPSLVDLDGDGRMEILVGTGKGELCGFDLAGDRLENYPKSTGGSVDLPLTLATAGSKAALFALSREGEINAFAVNEPASVEWNGAYGGARNLGSYVRPLAAPTPIGEAIGYVYNYPNPAVDETTIRFSVRETGKVTLKFYNLAGDLVSDGEFAAVAGVDNEYHFDCKRLASGVYFCQLETLSGDRKHCTVAIIR